MYATVLEETQTGVLAQHTGHESVINQHIQDNDDDDEKDVETHSMKQRSALAVGLHTTENYKMPQKTKLQNKD
jgi:hypothetical protein